MRLRVFPTLCARHVVFSGPLRSPYTTDRRMCSCTLRALTTLLVVVRALRAAVRCCGLLVLVGWWLVLASPRCSWFLLLLFTARRFAEKRFTDECLLGRFTEIRFTDGRFTDGTIHRRDDSPTEAIHRRDDSPTRRFTDMTIHRRDDSPARQLTDQLFALVHKCVSKLALARMSLRKGPIALSVTFSGGALLAS